MEVRMSRKHREQGLGRRRLTRFELDAPAARGVFVAGTFNDWRPDATPMTWQDGGHWVADVDVPAGRHEYKFVVDGSWCCGVGPDGPLDRMEGGVPNGLGTTNRVIEVGE
jgi:1,4-alpha-glucan branching enzyme